MLFVPGILFFILLVFGLLAVKFNRKQHDKTIKTSVLYMVAALLFQPLFLMSILLDKNRATSETWMALGLGYIPLCTFLGLILDCFMIVYIQKSKKPMQSFFKSILLLSAYVLCSYLILSTWGRIFNLSL